MKVKWDTMVDIGFSELFLIAVVALIFIGPKDLPVVARHVMKAMRELRDVYNGLKKQMHDVLDEAGMDDIKHNVSTIIDMDGKPQKAYNINDLVQLEAKKITEVIVEKKDGAA